ncbi:FMN reductase [Lampropedia hyalina DSM 16112]|uniref:FMN reductase n=1 Tax=Lampropedia hyalina DSM 16112 TaxID=1122156 RepID=A0A1M4Z5C7_9BURK|nr:NAD(P)H-dependent oxidoreductase [Lampropedia hyalina]SHF13259.1 FMN reductase [Lampropedia hyalina DSM 16112]
MSHSLRTVVLNGSLHKPSRTQVLLHSVHGALNEYLPLETQFIELVDLVPHIGTALSTQNLHPQAQQAIAAIEEADFLIVGSPVFRGSIPGLLKHLFDLIQLEALVGKPVLLAATGGSQRHSLVIDHQLRPLLAFFQSLILPIGVYGTQQEIDGGRIVDDALRSRIQLTAQLALPTLRDLAQRKQATTVRTDAPLEEQAA